MYSAVPPPDKRLEDANNDNTEATKNIEKPPPSVSEQTWKKFQELKERRKKCCKNSTDKRIKQLKADVTKTVFEEMGTAEEVSLLREFGVSQPRKHLKRSVKTEKRRPRESESTSNRMSKSCNYGDSGFTNGGEINIRHNQIENKLEADCNSAVKAGDFQLAEQLNDEIIQQDMANKAVAVLKCQEYVKRKNMELENTKAKKKKLHWAFEQKHRWESKGNM